MNEKSEDKKVKVLHEVLLEEYQGLGIFTGDEVADIEKKIDAETKKKQIELTKIDENTEPSDPETKKQKEIVVRSKYKYRMLEIIRHKIHAKEVDKRPTALCLSGGGIRSATFCLGVLQGLAKKGLLSKFDYLSTVSGGGYIGSWFSAWLYREGNIDKLQSALSRNGDYPYLFGLEDFEIKFSGDFNNDSKMDKKLILLEEKLSDEKIKELFFPKETNKLADRKLPRSEELTEIPASQIEFRKFGQDLCYELNQIIHDEQNESPSLKKKIIDKLEEDNSQTRKEIKRQIIEKKLTTEIIRKLDDFEHIEPPQITYLRSYSNFMSPRTGLFSIDTWTLIIIYFRNLFLNWTVFLPLIAVFLLLPKLFPAVLNSSLKNYSPHISFWIFVIAGVFAVTGIIAMRPSLSDSSWIKQEYKIDENGMLNNAQSKVVRWALLPMIIVSFVITAFWVWAQDAINTQFINTGEQFINLFPVSFAESRKLFRFIIIYEILFLGGFVIAHSVLKFLKLIDTNAENKDLFRNWKQLIWEFVASFLSGAVGGVTLYIFSNLLLRLNQYGNSIKFEDNYIYACFGPPLFLFSVLISTAFFFGIAGKIYSDMDREWLSRFGAMNLMFIVGWSILSGLILLSPSIIAKDNFSILKFNWLFDIIPIPPSLAIIIISGLITLVLGFSGKTPATEEKEAKSLKSSILKIAPQIAAPIFALFLIILISYWTLKLMDYSEVKLRLRFPSIFNYLIIADTEFWYLIFWILLFATIGVIMGFFININKFSLHAMYRERLIRAYLGASRTDNRVETANSFTDLDGKDNVEMYKLRGQKPYHVVNMTLNLGKASNLRWQDRKAASFTATPLYCGSSNMGDGNGNYRRSAEYGCSRSKNQAITLGTAAAVSGAAVSPSMGYYSMSPAVSFLMALFNVRLGWWFGNPGISGKDTYMRSAPKFAPSLFLQEAFGDTSDTNPYVYLSDGGHFDNLGLYEMVLRRCHFIVACDAGADPKFGFFDVGTAIHKIRVDMGIPIKFLHNQTPVEGLNCTIAEIKYTEVDANAEDGVLIYIKPTLDGDEPLDLVNYKTINPDFPHETTGDEFYSETQFESYRSLGLHMINSITGIGKDVDCNNIAKFVENAEKYLEIKNESVSKNKEAEQEKSSEK